MVFSSLEFLFCFSPIFLIVYFLSPSFLKNPVIFAASLVFYYYGVKDHPWYLALMLLTLAVNYGAARMIERSGELEDRKRWLANGLGWNIGCLFVFKYLDFLFENTNALLERLGSGMQFPLPELVLPIGISFYTFQISSYLIDVYRGKIRAERSLLTLGTYLCMFPQLIAGPIVTYSQMRRPLSRRKHSFAAFEEGMREFTIGLALKVLIANRVGNLWTQVGTIGFESISTPLAWLGIAAYSFQIYFDFYGYSLMAKGLGRMMGFRYPDNFDNPYLAHSMTDFWRRWHMTLGKWFRDYVYIPLGGNRSHHYRNLFLVWLLTGLWHGAGWNYILWGLFLFVLIALEKLGLKKFFDRAPLVGRIYMLLMIPISWLFFAVTDLKEIRVYLCRMFPFLGGSIQAVFAGDFLKYASACALPLLAAFLCCTGIPRKIYEEKKYSLPVTLGLLALFWACVWCMFQGLDDPFLYYQF